VIRPFGDFPRGRFRSRGVKCDESLSTSMVWQCALDRRIGPDFHHRPIGPDAGRASAATTLTLAGNPAAASRAVPEKRRASAQLSPSSEMPFASR